MIRYLIIPATVLIAFAVAQPQQAAQAQATEGYCMADYSRDHHIDVIGDISTLSAHVFETVELGSVYDLAMPPNGSVGVVDDLAFIAGMAFTECHGSYGTFSTEQSVTLTEGVVTLTVPVYVLCFPSQYHKPRHRFLGVPPNQIAAVDHDAYVYCVISPDPTNGAVGCFSQFEQDPPPLDGNYQLVASWTGYGLQDFCHANSPPAMPGWLHTYQMTKGKVCWWVTYTGFTVQNLCLGDEFPFMLVVV
jgi:hypothetical protein